MGGTCRAHDGALRYIGWLGARAAARSGRPQHRHHLGELILLALTDGPEFTVQIDGSTGECESSGSMLQRSVRCGRALLGLGLSAGDVIVLMAPNHLQLSVPLYAAMYQGIIVAPIDRTLTVNELRDTFTTVEPRAVFCQSERAGDVQRALNEAELSTHIITFDSGDYLCSFQQFLDQYGDDTPVEEFQVVDLEPSEHVAMLIATSGTTGLPKAAAATHENFVISGPYWMARFPSYPAPTRLALVCAPLQWLSAMVHFLMSPLFRFPRLQTPLPLTREHAHHIINTYKPTFATFSPTLMSTLLPTNPDECDFTCFEYIILGGSATPRDLIQQLKEITPETDVRNAFGMSELCGMAFYPDTDDPTACGLPMGCLQYRLVDVESQQDITEPNQPGELWLKGPVIFKGYHNNPEATAEAFAEGGWFRSGDIFYRDPHWGFYFVERHKLLLKYMSHHISPVELEAVIRMVPGVGDVAVTGVADPAGRGELPVACVVRRGGEGGGIDLTAQDIKDIVAERLSDAKQLRGGVIFLDSLPLTASTKLHRRRLRDIANTMPRE